MIAAALVSPTAALDALVAGLLATLVARAGPYPRLEWRRGLYGYAAALAGLFWPALFAQRPLALVVLLAVAVLAPPATRLAHRLLTPLDLPTLAWPALALTWLAVPILGVAPQGRSPAWPALLAAGVIAAVGLALYSRLLAGTALLGAAVGIAMLALGAEASGAAVLSNTVPTAMALGAVFVPWSTGSLVLAIPASLAAAAVLALAGPWLATLGLPPLVAPFALVALAALVGLRVAGVRRWLPGRPAAIPIVAVGHPELAAAHWRARRRLLALLRGASRVCVLSGAGVSTAAGLPDFRGPFGLAARGRRVTLKDFVADAAARAEYWQQEEAFVHLVRRASPAPLHRALAELHRRGRLSAVVTQNVDALHQAAGVPDERVIEIHGHLREVFCLDCAARFPREDVSERLAAGHGQLYCPACQGLLKSAGVMFGERVSPDVLDRALQALLASDVLLILGTSLTVFPVADMLQWARQAGIPVAIVNATPTPFDSQATIAVIGDVGPIVCDAVDLPA
jgi:NAD-dependent protein deacetylase/lipoamidase